MTLGRAAAVGVLALVTLVGAFAQNRRKVDINTETPEGQALQAIGAEEDSAKKIALLEAFAAKFPQNPNLPWVHGQLQIHLVKTSQHDKLIPVVEKLLAYDAGDAEMAYSALQAAVAKKDTDLIMKWAQITNEAGKKGAQTPKPSDEDEEAMWKYRVDFSQQVQKRCEYEVFTASLAATDPAKKILLMDALVALNPKGEYTANLDEVYFQTYRQMNNNAKAMEIATKLTDAGGTNEDMIILVANSAFEAKDADKTIKYSNRLVEVMGAKAAPQGVSAEDWQKKKNTMTGLGLWMVGMTHAAKANLKDTDTVLRQAVPLLTGNDLLLSHALFQLGLANHKMGTAAKGDPARIQEAYTFFAKCAAVNGPNKAQAAGNVRSLKQTYRGLK